jgi:uncharacterized membrane protein YhfC
MVFLQALLVVVGPFVLGWWIHRRFGASWGSWGWGALTFTASQVLLRIPLLAVVTIALQGMFQDMNPDTAFWINLVVLSLTAGLFEEIGRYLVMRFLAKKVRDGKEGLMFGAGHGGIEAILLVGASAAVNLALLTGGDTILAQVQGALQPDQLELFRGQIEALRTMAWWMPLLAVWERVLAITFHISASLLVLYGVLRGEAKWMWLSVLYHTLYNVVALLAVRYTGAVGAEVALTVVTIVPIYLIVYFYRLEQQSSEIEEAFGGA